MDNPTSSPTFISYSRRQLYFAESIALHLQKEGLDIWFDLQQLQAGTVWADGLKGGIQDARKLVLIVSRASLASKYVEVEWKGVLEKGNEVVLVIFEEVVLPKELQGLPTYDFRTGFNRKISDLASYLKGEAESRHDKVSAPNRFSLITHTPGAIWMTLAAQFSPLIFWVLGIGLMYILDGFVPWGSFGPFTLGILGLSVAISLFYGIPFLRHKLPYTRIKRSVVVLSLLLIPNLFMMVNISGQGPEDSIFNPIIWFLVVLLYNLFVYLFLLRRSINVLRWMQPEESVQKLRRRVHQPLVAKEKFDVDTESKSAIKSSTYLLHHDPADRPLANWMTKIFKKAGHKQVSLSEDPQHHIAILSNRSSVAWAQEVTRLYAGKIVFVIVSTIEFKKSLGETGRYQWIDARDMDPQDILSLAKSMGDAEASKREVALEATPDKIDRWKVPSGISLLKILLELFGAYVLVRGLTNIIPLGKDDIVNFDAYSILLILSGSVSFWLIAKGFVQRRLPPWVVYGLILLMVILVSVFGNILLLDSLQDKNWLFPALIIPLLVISAIDGRYWLPSFAKTNPDEVGIDKSIVRAYWKKRLIVVAAWVFGLFGLVLWMKYKFG